MKKVSIIIPAYNEEKHIKETIESLKKDSYQEKEIIVVANGCKDNTFKIAEHFADKALNFEAPIGVCSARNEGAKIAKGDLFIFVDADSHLSKDAVFKISSAINEKEMGSCLGSSYDGGFRAKLFFFWKNWTHRLRIYKGVIDGVFFCSKDLFLLANGFSLEKKIAEFEDFIERAKKLGGKYKLLTNCYAITSMRRYESKGYIKTLFFWIWWKILSLFGKQKNLESTYFKK